MSGRGFNLVSRATRRAVALETTLLVHGVPKGEAAPLAREIEGIIRSRGAEPALVGVVAGVPTVGMTSAELRDLLSAPDVPKANTANLGAMIHRGLHAATTVSATMELAAAAGVSVFATGGLGGVHRGFGDGLDISSDLAAFTRFPVAVVASGVKSLLDVSATREALETLGIPVVGFQTDAFPAFYRRASDDGAGPVDVRFDDEATLARFVASELARTGRGVVVANPIPAADEIDRESWERWLEEAENARASARVSGRAVTPFLLARLHELSGGATLRANLALVRSNARLAATIAATMG